MTIHEAIDQLKSLLDHCKTMRESGEIWARDCEALRIAIAALRGPTREQVEKEWRTHWVSVDSGRVSRCAHCGFEALYPEIYTFCPDCGRPFTDYAVDILLKRFEVLKDGKKAD